MRGFRPETNQDSWRTAEAEFALHRHSLQLLQDGRKQAAY